eukprot:scaffold261680_cov18-Prasinocladus_malaysianus.AAC.1
MRRVSTLFAIEKRQASPVKQLAEALINHLPDFCEHNKMAGSADGNEFAKLFCCIRAMSAFAGSYAE